MRLETPAQTAGPYIHMGTLPAVAGLDVNWHEGAHVLPPAAGGEKNITLKGKIFDGGGAPVTDAVIEIFQADASGAFHTTTFPNWGRAYSDFETGEWTFHTVRPGPTARSNRSIMAPHVLLAIFARGMNGHLTTLMYFPDDEIANARDPILSSIDPQRRGTLVAQRDANGGEGSYRFDIFLQGDRETAFFNI